MPGEADGGQSNREPLLIRAIALFFATGAYVGYAPFAPGTVGTLWGIPAVFLFLYLPPAGSIAFLVLFILFSIWCADSASKTLNKKDPSEVVIDEYCAYALGIYLIPWDVISILLLFFLFRFFDIVKPFPARQLESLKGGWGIVLDDLMAVIYAVIALKLIYLVVPLQSLWSGA